MNAPDPEVAESALPRVLQNIGSVVAPTSLLTALFVHLGMMDAIGYFQHFGINHTVLGLPFSDYLTLSTDSTVLPLLYLAVATALGLWIYHLPFTAMPARVRWFTVLVIAPVIGAAGFVAVGSAIVDIWLDGRLFPPTFVECRGLSLAVGVVLIGFAGRLRRLLASRRAGSAPTRGGVARMSVIFLLLSLGLFWAFGSYAAEAGNTRARGFAAILHCRPDVVLYSEKSLNLTAPGVRESVAANPDPGFRFRYSGLKLVPQSGSQYVLLPGDWTPGDGVAIVLPRGPTLRLELSRSPELYDPNCG